MIVTKHATDRARERMGIPRKSTDRIATRAFDTGVHREDTAGSLRRYLDKVYFKHGDADNIRVFAYFVYVFSGTALLTVFPLPQQYKSTIDKINRRNADV